jgi:hypothetical protein
MNTAMNTAARPALTRRDRADIAGFTADLARGKVGLGWTPFVLTLAAVAADRLEWALAEILPYGDAEDMARSTYLYETGKVERFAARHGAVKPELLVKLINACASACEVAEGQVAGILAAALDGKPLN